MQFLKRDTDSGVAIFRRSRRFLFTKVTELEHYLQSNPEVPFIL